MCSGTKIQAWCCPGYEVRDRRQQCRNYFLIMRICNDFIILWKKITCSLKLWVFFTSRPWFEFHYFWGNKTKYDMPIFLWFVRNLCVICEKSFCDLWKIVLWFVKNLSVQAQLKITWQNLSSVDEYMTESCVYTFTLSDGMLCRFYPLLTILVICFFVIQTGISAMHSQFTINSMNNSNAALQYIFLEPKAVVSH